LSPSAIKCDEPEEVAGTDMDIVGVHYPLPVHHDCVLGYAINPGTTISGRERQTMECLENGEWNFTAHSPCLHSECHDI